MRVFSQRMWSVLKIERTEPKSIQERTQRAINEAKGTEHLGEEDSGDVAPF